LARNPSHLKRQKELARLEWQQEKRAKRQQRNAEKDERERTGAPEVGDATAPQGPESPGESRATAGAGGGS
jgi:hypothetical protein